MSLQTKISKGKLSLPKRLLVHGAPGVGKSTFASGAPDVLFIDPEKRTDHLDVARVQPETWPEILQTLVEVIKDKPCKTLVFSTLDFIEGMVQKHVIATNGGGNLIDVGGGYGKGYQLAADEFKRLSNATEQLRQAGITTVFECHSAVTPFNNPAGENYDYWAIKLDKRVRAIFMDRCDAIGFAMFDDVAHKKKGENKAKALTTGERILMFKHSAAHETKRGFDLPDEIELTWSAWEAAVAASQVAAAK